MLALTLVAGMGAWALAQSPPMKQQHGRNSTPIGLGFNVHIMGTDQDWDAIKAAGAKFIRADFAWGKTEKAKGEYDFSAFDQMLASLDKKGIRALFILDYGNRLYPAPETTEEGREAYAKWAAAAAKHFKGRNVIWEIWNEPNVHFWKGNGGMNSVQFADDYVALVKKTVPAMRTADPDCYIVGGSVSCLWVDSFRWIDRAFEQGLLQTGINALSVHPYGFPCPEKCIDDGYGVLRQKMETAGAPKGFPVLNTEVGYPTKWKKGTRTRTLGEQATLFVRQYLVDQMCNIPMTIWYNWDENDAEFHKVRSNGPDPLPVYNSCKNMSAELAGYHFVERLKVGSDMDYMLAFENESKGRKIIAWTAAPQLKDVQDEPSAHEVSIPTGTTSIAVRDLYGKAVQAKAAVTLNLSDSPLYIDLGGKPAEKQSAPAAK